MNQPVRVLIVDDYSVVRQGLRALLATAADIEFIGEAMDGETAVRLANKLQPDVIVIDLVLPRLTGLEAIKTIQTQNPHIHTLVLTDISDEPLVLAALKAGASGYLLKDAIQTNILDSIRHVATGELAFHPLIAQTLQQSAHQL